MPSVFQPRLIQNIPEIDCKSVYNQWSQLNGKVRLIDVRRPDEFNGELGHIEGAELFPLGPELIQFLDSADKSSEIVFICRSGARSGSATAESLRLGFKCPMNLTGGMLEWNLLKLPTVKN